MGNGHMRGGSLQWTISRRKKWEDGPTIGCSPASIIHSFYTSLKQTGKPGRQTLTVAKENTHRHRIDKLDRLLMINLNVLWAVRFKCVRVCGVHACVRACVCVRPLKIKEGVGSRQKKDGLTGSCKSLIIDSRTQIQVLWKDRKCS